MLSTPSRRLSASVEDLEPLTYQPSDIANFLHYAEEKLGVQDAMTYEHALHNAAFGPDILSKVPLAHLMEIGIKAGDAVRLREQADAWWNSQARSARKRAMQDEEDFNHQPAKRACISYRTSYHGGGEKRWHGEPVVKTKKDYVPNPDIKLVEYYNEALHAFCPVPEGYRAKEDTEFDSDDEDM